MLKASRFLAVLLLVLVSSPALSQEPPTPSDMRSLALVTKLLTEKGFRFLNHARDFAEYRSSSPDYVRSMRIAQEARASSDLAAAASVMLVLYAYISHVPPRDGEEPERASVRRLLQDWLTGYISQLQKSVSITNYEAGNTQSAMIANSAERMKDDLRETIELLKSIKLP